MSRPKNKLPDKAYFNPQELAVRWDCSVGLIKDYVQSGRLIGGMFLDHEKGVRIENPGVAANSDSIVDFLDIGAVVQLNGFHEFIDNSQIRSAGDEFEGTAMKIDRCHVRSETGDYFQVDSDISYSTGGFDHDPFDLYIRISKSEIDRFERENKILIDAEVIDSDIFDLLGYRTPLLEVLVDTIQRYWTDYDESDESTRPESSPVIQKEIYLRHKDSTGISMKMAERIDMIARHPSVARGGRKKNKENL